MGVRTVRCSLTGSETSVLQIPSVVLLLLLLWVFISSSAYCSFLWSYKDFGAEVCMFADLFKWENHGMGSAENGNTTNEVKNLECITIMQGKSWALFQQCGVNFEHTGWEGNSSFPYLQITLLNAFEAGQSPKQILVVKRRTTNILKKSISVLEIPIWKCCLFKPQIETVPFSH